MIRTRNIALTIILGFLPGLHAWAQHTYTLEQLLDSARSHNIALRNGQRDIEAAQEQRKEAFTKFFPTVSATGAWFNANKSMAQTELDLTPYITPELGATLAQLLPAETLVALSSPMSISMMKHGTIASITAIQPVFAGGQIINGNKLAKIGEEVSRLRQQLSEDEVETTAEQYFNDLLKVELRQNEVESQKVKIQNGMALVKMLLAQYCGLRDTSFTLRYTTEAISPLSIKRDHQQALLNTPEYQLLDKQVEATSLQKKMAVGENLPSVAVGAGYNYHNLLGSDQTFGMIFATVSVPLSNWWGGSHAIKRKKIAQQQAIDQRDDNAELLTIRMQKAWNDVEEAYQQLHIAERSIRQAEENLRLSRNCYQAGTTTMSDLLEAQMLYQQALDKRTDLFADYQNKVLEYKHAVGM